MPLPGDQHLNHAGQPIINPFEEVKPHISEYTAQEIASLQSRLEKQLGPEYISSRAGPSGQKVHYLAAEKCIQLANEVFGFNGWSSQIMNVQVDFVDENPQTSKVSLGLSVVVRVTLRDGTFHEDIGYGHIENCKGKAAAFEKAKKEGTTDGLKRALRNFGNVLGNCIYDKEYLAKVTKVKVAPTKWDVEGLHRHSNYAPLPAVKKEREVPAPHLIKQSAASEAVSPDTLDDEFGDFDDADFAVSHDTDSHPDEVVLPISAASHSSGTGNYNNDSVSALDMHQSNGPSDKVGSTPTYRPQTVPAPIMLPAGNHSTENNNGKTGPQVQQPFVKPQTPSHSLTRSISGGNASTMRPPQDGIPVTRGVQGAPSALSRVLNQPSRAAAASAPTSPIKQQNLSSNDDDTFDLTANLGPNGFFSAKAASMLPASATSNGPPPVPGGNLPAFNPQAESPSIRKTPGVDHTKTRPTTRGLKHVPGSSQTSQTSPSVAPIVPTNIINPQLNVSRRIGAPGSPSPMGNRGAYKPPTMKRPSDGVTDSTRPPLSDLPANGMQAAANNGNDIKRQRLNGP